jgi:hypothetical protein
MLAQGRLPECWIPPTQVLEARALLQVYRDLRRDHTAWVQRIHAVLCHQGATACTDLGMTAGRERLAKVAREQLSPAGQVQVRAGVLMLEATEAQLEILHRHLLATARHMKGLQHRELMAQDEDLGVLRRVRTGQQRQSTDQTTSDQVPKTQPIDTDHVSPTGPAKPQLNAGAPSFGHPQGAMSTRRRQRPAEPPRQRRSRVLSPHRGLGVRHVPQLRRAVVRPSSR